ncbi:MAG: Gfo/Idh/MocA family oxidoreductase [Deltaproteobacteria bacterium]|nr:Gfo/Idh/MocA family oxidoreductase [Deltaproteobacteria bacterium]
MSSPTRFRVALLGCGRIAHVHAGYLRQVPEVDFVGACDLEASLREAFTARWQVPTYAEIDELLAASQPDVVHLLTPPATHPRLAVELLQRGVHLMVEKPMAFSVAEADAMVQAAQIAGRLITVDHNRWFDPVVQRARHLLESGRLGSLVGVEVFAGAAVGEADLPSAEHWKASLPGGILYDLAPHPVYLLLGFLGDVKDLQVVHRSDANGHLEEVRAIIDGTRCLGSLTISANTRPFANRISLYGSNMSAEVNLNNMTLIVRQTRQVPKLVGKVLPNLDEAAQLLRATLQNGAEFVTGRQRFFPGMGLHFRELYRALSEGRPAPVSARDGRNAVWLLQEIWKRCGVSMVPGPGRVASK